MRLQRLAVIGMALFLSAVAPLAAMAQDGPPAPAGMAGAVVLRYGSLASGEVYMRQGPGTRYPIKWIYGRRNWPVGVIAEFENWRQVRDADGVEGWVHRALLNGTRHGLVIGQIAELYAEPDRGARLLARLEPGVIVALTACAGAWCEAEIDGIAGFVARDAIWGTAPDEAFD